MLCVKVVRESHVIHRNLDIAVRQHTHSGAETAFKMLFDSHEKGPLTVVSGTDPEGEGGPGRGVAPPFMVRNSFSTPYKCA